ncbi:hypothetical protein ACP70R_048691 [Stipagrostis hirtigluma subsp. patula]
MSPKDYDVIAGHVAEVLSSFPFTACWIEDFPETSWEVDIQEGFPETSWEADIED